MTAELRVLAEHVGFAEGPVVAPDGAIMATSVDQARLYRIDADGLRTVAETGGGANGAALAGDGCLYVAQNGGRWARFGPSWTPDSVGGVQRVDTDGSVSWVTRDPIAPNDLCFGPDGLLYVTDPTRAPKSTARQVDGRIWRVDPADGATELLESVPWFTNGIAFGPDDALYVAATHTAAVYRVDPASEYRPELVIQLERGGPDGIAFDADGNLVIAAVSQDDGPGTIQTWSTDGRHIATFAPGDSEMYTNIAFTPDGGLVITDAAAGRLLLMERWRRPGLALHPFRA